MSRMGDMVHLPHVARLLDRRGIQAQEKFQVLNINCHKGLPVDIYPSIETQFTVQDIKEIPVVNHILWLN